MEPQDKVIPSDSLRQMTTTEASLGRLSPEGQATYRRRLKEMYIDGNVDKVSSASYKVV